MQQCGNERLEATVKVKVKALQKIKEAIKEIIKEGEPMKDVQPLMGGRVFLRFNDKAQMN